MATEFCQKCKQSHPGRICDYDDKGECAETLNVEEGGNKGEHPDDMPRETRPMSREENS
jgi:hypothetical protein